MNCPHASGTSGTATLNGICIGCWKERCESAEADSSRLDWLQEIMTPPTIYVEVYLAGLRKSITKKADSFQFEANPHHPAWCLETGSTLRDAIDKAMRAKEESGV